MKDLRTTARTLGLAGLIPFAAMVFFAGWGAPAWAEQLLVTYAILVLAFMSGSLWSLGVLRDREDPRELILSNVLALAGWPAIIMPYGWALIWLALGYGVHFFAEMRWTGGQYPGWYRGLRTTLSLSVVVMLVLAAVLYWTRG